VGDRDQLRIRRNVHAVVPRPVGAHDLRLEPDSGLVLHLVEIR
jgi:hypothetical protein